MRINLARLVTLTLGAFAACSLAYIAPQYADAETLATPLLYTFNAPGTLFQTSAMQNSSSPYWWVVEGGHLVIEDGVGKASAHSPYMLLSKQSAQDASAQVYIDRLHDDYSELSERQPYNGEEIIARYQSADNYYYAGIRADGYAVIKKKMDGLYQTLAMVKLLPGMYDPSGTNELIPLGRWIGLKFSVVDDAADAAQLSLYVDLNDTGVWSLALSATDNSTQGGAALEGAGLWGVESDYADAQFDNFLFTPQQASLVPIISGSDAAQQAPASASYDALVLADAPALYLTMSSPSTGNERDASGHGLNGTYEGGAPGTATLPDGSTAADFSGTGEYLSVPSAASLSIPTTGELTWEGWVRPDTFDFPVESADGYVDWMGKCETYSPACEWEARIYGDVTSQSRADRLSAYAFNASAGLGSAADWQPAANLSAGQWLYVVAEYQTNTTPQGCSSKYPGTISIWVNGVEQDFAAHAPTGCMSQYGITPKDGSSPLTIGTMALDTFFKGAIGKVAIYDHLLSQSQIDAHYETMTGKEPAGQCGLLCTLGL